MMYRGIALAFLCMFLTGCVSAALEDNKAAPVLYVLKANMAGKQLRPKPAIIKIIQPTIAEGLDSNRIAVLEHGRRLKYLEQARWTGTLGNVIKRFVLDNVNAPPTITALGEEDYSLNTDYRLLIDISAMQAEYEEDAGLGTPSAHIAVQLILSDYRSNTMLHVVNLDKHIPLESNSTTAIIEAYETALHDATQQILTALAVM